MLFKILEVFTQNGQLVVKAQHYNADGSVWFVEHYTFQGREGVKQKRAVNALGQLLLDDDTVAPTELDSPGVTRRAVLPVGRQWKFRPGPHMDNGSILSVIQSTHRQRVAAGWPQGQADQLPAFTTTPVDDAGASTLLAKFLPLIGRAV